MASGGRDEVLRGQVPHIGTVKDMWIRCYADADLAGDVTSTKFTSGVWVDTTVELVIGDQGQEWCRVHIPSVLAVQETGPEAEIIPFAVAAKKSLPLQSLEIPLVAPGG
eukprot:3543971-Amphidinium_carterae.3